jgi:hypothetical protein
MIFYTTPETLSESTKPTSVDHEADIANIQENIVDSSKWIELLGEKSDSSMLLPDTSNNYGEGTSLEPFSVERNTEKDSVKEEILKDNTEVSTESTSTIEANNGVEVDKVGLLQDSTSVHAENTDSDEASKREEGDREGIQHDSTEVNTESTSTEETNNIEEDKGEWPQQDITEFYTHSTITGETRERDDDKEEPKRENTEVYTESTNNDLFNSLPTHRTEEDKTDTSSGKLKNEIAGTWSDETSTTQNHPILGSEEANNSGNMGEDVNSADATKTMVHPSDDNGMMKDGGVAWYIGEVKKSSTESVKYETSQETERHEITTSKSEVEEGGSGTESPQYGKTMSTEGALTESTVVHDNIESKTDEGKYDEDYTETGSFENISTTTVPDRHTQSMEQEPIDTVPVISFLNDMETPHMDIVLPDSENDKMQKDYDIKKFEINPVTGIESELDISSEYSSITKNSAPDGQNTKEVHNRVFQNSNEGSGDIDTDEYSLAPSTTSPASHAATEFQPTETTDASESTETQDGTAYTTKYNLSVTTILMHVDPTKAQNEEYASPTDEATTSDILEGENPLNSKEIAQTTEHMQENSNEDLQGVTTANSISDSNNLEESKTVMYKNDEGISHTQLISETSTENTGNTASSYETEKNTYSTTDATQFSEKILATVTAFKSNKTASMPEISTTLPKEWLKASQQTTETNTAVAHLEANESQTEVNGDKEEEIISTVNYNLDNRIYSYEAKSGETADQSKETDITKVVSTTESTLTTLNSFESTDKFVDNPSNKNDSQTLENDIFNEHQTTDDNATDITSDKMDVTSGEHGTSLSNYNIQATEIPFHNNPISQQNENYSKWESTDARNSGAIPQETPTITGDSRLDGSFESESLNYNENKSGDKQSNKFDKIYPESFSTEDKSINYDQHTPDEPVFVKEAESALYSIGSYEMNFHDIYGTGDYYVSSSESGLTHGTDMNSEAASTITSPSSVEHSTDAITVRNRNNENTGRSSQELADIETTVPPTEVTTTNRTESELESTTPRMLENVYNSDEATDNSEVKVQTVEDNQDADIQARKSKNENVAIVKTEKALYDLSDSQEESDSKE